MDSQRFDALSRALAQSRRSILGASLATLGGMLGIATVEAKKKKKKPCKKKCKDGCCTSKNGKCIKPAQQTPTQCGTGGEICRNNCGGSGSCKDDCVTCCAGDACVAEVSNAQCGVGGEDCFACPAGQACNAPGPGCCAKPGEACGSNGVECCPTLFVICGPNNECCIPNHNPCTETNDCCDEEDICDNGFCGRPKDAACVPGDVWCTPQLVCNPTTLKCSDCPEEDICGDTCCTGGQQCFGTVCCDPEFGCASVNGGLGTCCGSRFCCAPDGNPPCLCEFDGCCG